MSYNKTHETPQQETVEDHSTEAATPGSNGESSQKLIERMAKDYGIAPDKFLALVKKTSFRYQIGSDGPTNQQVARLLIVANKYSLDPFTGELYGQPTPGGDVLPVLTVDGWSRLINSHLEFDGLDFLGSEKMVQMSGATSVAHEWMEVKIWRKDRSRPTIIREYLDEVYKPQADPSNPMMQGPWQTHPKRCLRHKTLIQGARIAFGYTGVYDPDEASNIVQTLSASKQTPSHSPRAAKIVYQDEDQVNELLDKLFVRAKEDDNWKQCVDYLRDRLQNQPEMREYALQRLSDEQVAFDREKVSAQKTGSNGAQPSHH